MCLLLALKKYACNVFAVGLFVFVFPVYLSQGWLAFWTDLCRQKANVFQILPTRENERPLRPEEKGLSDLKTAGPTLGNHSWVREFMFGICSCHMCPYFAGAHVACALPWPAHPLDPTDTKRYTPDVLESPSREMCSSSFICCCCGCCCYCCGG